MFEQAFKNIDDVLWKEAGCSSELDYTEQSSWMLFLKYLDDLEQERAVEAHQVEIRRGTKKETPRNGIRPSRLRSNYQETEYNQRENHQRTPNQQKILRPSLAPAADPTQTTTNTTTVPNQ